MMTNHKSDYGTIRECLFKIFNGERATFADRINIIQFIDDLHANNASLKRTVEHRDVQLGIMVDKVSELRLENRKLREMVEAMQVCEDDDADAHDCPLYDENEPTRCAYGRIADELGV